MHHIQKPKTTGINIQHEPILQTGSVHLSRQEACEDVIYVEETEAYCFYGLADGQSGKRFGSKGGLVCLKRLAEYVSVHGVRSLAEYRFPDELPCMLTQEIRRCLLAQAERDGGDFSDYASTLLAIAIDPIEKQYILLHLGDGCALGVYPDDSVMMLSCPENGLTQYHTWLTTSDHAASHFRVTFGTLRNQKRMVFLSDGADSLCRGKNILPRAKTLLCRGSREEVVAFVRSSRPEDDAGCIVLDFHTP